MLEQLLPILVAAIVGAIVMPVFQGLKKVSTLVDGLNPWIKRIAVVVLSFGAVALSRLVGIEVPSDILGMDSTALQTVLGALVAYLLHFLMPKPKPVV